VQVRKDVAISVARHTKKAPPAQYITRGPISINDTVPYDSFLTQIAAALPCPPGNIPQGSMVYRAQIPANSPELPVGSQPAYKAMFQAFKSKRSKGPYAVFITMDKPMKPAVEGPVSLSLSKIQTLSFTVYLDMGYWFQ
jgi:hypothetical protein